MRIGIYSNPDKDPDFRIARHAAKLIRRHGAVCVTAPGSSESALITEKGIEQAEFCTCDLILGLGGDGTFLSLVHIIGCEEIPLIGVNLGSVGFLPEIMPEQLDEAICQIVSGHYHLENRMMLAVSCFDENNQLLEEGHALNDAVISRGGVSRILTLELTINQETIDHIPGDGLIISTPTGSTAYSLSAGGPIIHPELSLMLITPICPHTLHNRSYIATESSRVIVKIDDYQGQALLAIDGRQEIFLNSGSSVIIERSPRSLKMIRLGNDNFYAALPKKIQARGKAR